jgi:hypothetical protein
LPKDVEVGRIISRAAATKTAGAKQPHRGRRRRADRPDRRILAALLWDPIAGRRSED